MSMGPYEEQYRQACRNSCAAYKDFLKDGNIDPLIQQLEKEKIALAEFVTGIPFQPDCKYRDLSHGLTKDNKAAMKIRADVMDCFGFDTTAIDQLIAGRQANKEPLPVLPGLEEWT